MGIKIGDSREIDLLDSINDENAINFKVGNKFAELTENIAKTKGSPQLKFTRLSDNKAFYIKESYLIKENLVLNLRAVDMKDQPLTIWEDKSPSGNDFTLCNLSETATSGYNDTNKTLNFDGSDDYAQANSPIIPEKGDFTLSIRFIHRGGQTWERLLTQWISGSSTRTGFNIKDNRVFFQIGDRYKQFGPTFINERIYILEFKRLENTFYFYLDGNEIYSTSYFENASINQANTTLSKSTNYSRTSYLNVVAYHRALSDEERLYNISVMEGDLNE